MHTTRRNALRGLAAAGALPLFNIGCAGFGLSRARQIGKGSVLKWDGSHVTNNKEADRHVAKKYRSGWDPFA